VKLLAALGAAAAFAAGSAPGPRVLGVDYVRDRLAWFDPATLRPLAGGDAPLARHRCSWSFSPQHALLALGACGTGSSGLRFVDVRTMRVTGTMPIQLAGHLGAVSWVRPNRVLATLTLEDRTDLLVIDPVARRVLRRVPLPFGVWGVHRLGDRVVFLLASQRGFAPARVAVADGDGRIRTVRLDRISAGSEGPRNSNDVLERRGAGFALDAGGGRVLVVGANLTVAEVDVATLAVRYHPLVARSLAKAISGSERTAEWLGGGLLALAGTDYATTLDAQKRRTTTMTPFGVRLVDTHDWTMRTIDGSTSWFRPLPDGVLTLGNGVAVAYGRDGAERWRLPLARSNYVTAAGRYVYVCSNNLLRRVVDAADGRTLVTLDAAAKRACAAVLRGGASDW
jgi:hypothetical protein